tara:strand:+ start:985 stop:1416 length:432 start_codon:yes stop_codon:yes gene_type:complete
MNIATIDDFDKVWGIFQDNKEWFPHVWNTKIKKRIENKQVVFENNVVITFSIYKRNNKIGNLTALKDDCILHQIVKGKNGNARKTIEDFFNFVNTNVYLTVRENNLIANKFYEKVGMKKVGTISWAEGTMPGLIWKKDLTNNA